MTRLCPVKLTNEVIMSTNTRQTSSRDPLLDPQPRHTTTAERAACGQSDTADTVADLRRTVAQLEEALQSRIVIEQAKGVLAERLAIPVNEAFELLRAAARSHRLRIHELARRVVDEGMTPPPVITAVARTQPLRATWMREVSEAHRQRSEELARMIAARHQRVADPRET